MTDLGGARTDGAAGEPSRTTVLLVDDHAVFSGALALALEAEDDLHVVGTAKDLRSATGMAADLAPDVVLLDQRLPDGDGVAAIPHLVRAAPSTRVVVLTGAGSDEVLLAAMQRGAAGFVAKTSGLEEVVSAVRAAARDETVVDASLLARLLPRLRDEARGVGSDLTEREREVLGLLAEGLPNATIAQRLFVSVHTVRNHVANLSAKLGAHSKLEALSIAMREGLLPPRP